MMPDRVRLRGMLTDLENEWATWMSTDPNSTGRIDASCILVYGLIPEANKGAIVHAPLPTAPQPGQVAADHKRAVRQPLTAGESGSDQPPGGASRPNFSESSDLIPARSTAPS